MLRIRFKAGNNSQVLQVSFQKKSRLMLNKDLRLATLCESAVSSS
jgi:hypothetical protein